MSMILFNDLEITSNEQFIVLSEKSTSGDPFPITIYYENLKYFATWCYITDIKFLGDGVIRPTILMQSIDVSEATELNSGYHIKIVSINRHSRDAYTEVILELKNTEKWITEDEEITCPKCGSNNWKLFKYTQ